MEQSLLERVGGLTLYFYVLAVLGLIIALVIRTALARTRAVPETRPERGRPTSDAGGAGPTTAGSRLMRILFEYVGNVDLPRFAPRIADRRRNRQARVIMDRLKEGMERREFPSGDREALMDELREAIRYEEHVMETQPPGVGRKDY